MNDPRGVVTALFISVLVFRPHLSGGTYYFAQELLLIPLLVGLGLLLLVPMGSLLYRNDFNVVSLPWMFGLWAAVTLLWSSDPGQGVRDLAALFLNLSAFTIVYLMGKDSRWLDRSVNWIFGLVVLPVTVVALYQRVFGFVELRSVLNSMSAAGDNVNDLMAVISRGRVFAGFLNPNMLAGFLAIFIPLTFDKALTSSSRFRAALYWALVMVQVVVLVLSGSMGGTVVAILAGGGVFLARKGFNRRGLSVMIVVVVLLAGGLLAIRGLGPIIGSESSFTQRAGYMGAGFRMAAVHPLLGWGAGSAPGSLMGYVHPGVRPVADPHNFLVRIWIELGITGLLIFGSFLYLLTRRVIETVRGTGLRLTADSYVGFLFAVAAFILHSFMDMDFFAPETALFGWCAIGGLLALSVKENNTEPDREISLPLRQGAGGLLLFAVLPALILLQGESVAFRGMKSHQAGEYTVAADLYREAGKLMPFNGRIALGEGRARFTAGERSEAVRLFQRADRLMAQSPYPPWELGRAAQAEDRWEESLPYLERAQSRYPNSPRILIDLARSNLNLGDNTSAAAYLEKALALSVFDSQAGDLARNLLDRMP